MRDYIDQFQVGIIPMEPDNPATRSPLLTSKAQLKQAIQDVVPAILLEARKTARGRNIKIINRPRHNAQPNYWYAHCYIVYTGQETVEHDFDPEPNGEVDVGIYA